MNPEDIFSQMMGGQQPQQIHVPQEEMETKVKEFIDRCLEDKDYTLHSLAQEIVYLLQPPQGHTTMLQIGMKEVLPVVLQQIDRRLKDGV